MSPFTAATPKPLLPLGGRPLIDHALDRLAAANVTRAVVSAHEPTERLARHLVARRAPPGVLFRSEPASLDAVRPIAASLETGALGPGPFFIVNADTLWLDGPCPALTRLANAFQPAKHDALLLLHRSCQVEGEVGLGDFFLDPQGTLRRRREREVAPFIFAGLQLAAPALFAAASECTESLAQLWDRALQNGRLAGLVHDGLWFRLASLADLGAAESTLHARTTGRTR